MRPTSFFIDTERPLGAALLLLDNALHFIGEFAERYPERMDATIADAMDHAKAAHGALDSTFYAEQNADPNAPEDEDRIGMVPPKM